MNGILFDARWVRPGMTGVGRFAYHLLRAESLPKHRCAVILNRDSPFAEEFAGYRRFFTGVDLIHHPMTDLYEQLAIPYLCYRFGYRRFVSFEGRAPALHFGIKTFPFFYDLSYRKIKGSHSRKYSFFLNLHLSLSRLFATRLLTISETVREEMSRLIKIDPDRIAVVYPAGSELASQPPLAVAKAVPPYFLAVGITNPRKNLAGILRAFAQAREKNPAVKLMVTGNPDLIQASFRQHGSEGAENLGFVSEGELHFLYRNALALAYASLDEGFGIPLIDAAAFACPVLCSDIPVFREVMGSQADYFDPHSAESIAAGMLRALSGACAKPDAGLLAKFNWENSARQLLAALDGD